MEFHGIPWNNRPCRVPGWGRKNHYEKRKKGVYASSSSPPLAAPLASPSDSMLTTWVAAASARCRRWAGGAGTGTTRMPFASRPSSTSARVTFVKSLRRFLRPRSPSGL